MKEEEHPAIGLDPARDAPWGWRDDPIGSVEEDRLERAHFARHAAWLIDQNHSVESSVVYGLEGPWGSGKSSVIALINAFLSATDNGRWSVVHFTPWATTGTDGLLSEFFAVLSAVAPQADRGQRMRDRLTAYADIARPIVASIPGVGSGLVEASRTLEQRLNKPWKVAFDEVSQEIRQLRRPILVVVDDIDRLQPSELLDLLKVVRLLGRFPGVDFLLAYDEQTVVETLRDPARGQISTARARAFMEKIVQYPLTMPPLLIGKVVKILSAGLTQILAEENIETDLNTRRLNQVVLTTMPSQLTTPRAIERFLAQVREQFRIHDLSEIDPVDLILATFLRVKFPDLFAVLQRWKTELTRGSVGWTDLGRRTDTQPDWQNLINVVEDEQDRRDAGAVLETLFPAVASKHADRAAPGRFAHPEYFDRYVAQTIPEGDIPDAVIAHALTQAAGGDLGSLRPLITAQDDEQVILALSKIRVRYPDIADPWARRHSPGGPVTVALLSAGMSLIDELDERPASWTSALSQTLYWMANVLRLLLDADPHANVDTALASCFRIQRRAHVISTAASTLDNVRPETSEALRATLLREAERILPVLLADLRQGDDADGETGNLFLYEIVDDAGLLPRLQQEVRRGIEADEFSLEDVAARFVSFAYLVGGPPRPSSASFAGAMFAKVTGVEADSSDLSERKEWTDIGWPRRKEFAARYIKSPSKTQDS